MAQPSPQALAQEVQRLQSTLSAQGHKLPDGGQRLRARLAHLRQQQQQQQQQGQQGQTHAGHVLGSRQDSPEQAGAALTLSQASTACQAGVASAGQLPSSSAGTADAEQADSSNSSSLHGVCAAADVLPAVQAAELGQHHQPEAQSRAQEHAEPVSQQTASQAVACALQPSSRHNVQQPTGAAKPAAKPDGPAQPPAARPREALLPAVQAEHAAAATRSVAPQAQSSSSGSAAMLQQHQQMKALSESITRLKAQLRELQPTAHAAPSKQQEQVP